MNEPRPKFTRVIKKVNTQFMMTDMERFQEHCTDDSTVCLKEAEKPFQKITKFPHCVQFVVATARSLRRLDIGRVYIRRLIPVQEIDLCHDRGQGLNTPEVIEIWDQGPNYPHSLLWCNVTMPHAYKNNSKEDCFLLVFDLSK